MISDRSRQNSRDDFPRRRRQTQFRLGALLRLMTGLCVVFAILGALGVDAKQTAAAFITSAVVALMAIGVVESWRKLSPASISNLSSARPSSHRAV